MFNFVFSLFHFLGKSQRKPYCLREVIGDLWALAPNDASLGHCVGADMAMSAGIAVDFKLRFGHVRELQAQQKNPGDVAVLSAELSGRKAPVFYLVTKPISTMKSVNWSAFVSSIDKLKKLVGDLDVHKLYSPRIRCGLDNLSWTDVRK